MTRLHRSFHKFQAGVQLSYGRDTWTWTFSEPESVGPGTRATEMEMINQHEVSVRAIDIAEHQY